MAPRTPAFLQAASHSAADVRLALGQLWTPDAGAVLRARSGVTPALGNPLLVSAPGGLIARVAPGRCVIGGTEATAGGLQGSYTCVNDANVDLAVAPTAAGQLRVDLIVARVKDAAYSGAANSFTLEVVQGVPAAAAPAEPAVPVSAIVLARIDLPAAAGAVLAGYLTDRRTYTAAQGGAVNVSTAERTALSAAATAADPAGLPEGFPVYDRDLFGLFCWTRQLGGAWVAQRQNSRSVQAKSVDGGNVTATTFTSALSGSSVLSLAFTAPDSGRVQGIIGAFLRPGGAQSVEVSAYITGGAYAETAALAPDERKISFQAGAGGYGGSCANAFREFGLIPGTVYTATMVQRTTAGLSALVDDRVLAITPLP